MSTCKEFSPGSVSFTYTAHGEQFFDYMVNLMKDLTQGVRADICHLKIFAVNDEVVHDTQTWWQNGRTFRWNCFDKYNCLSVSCCMCVGSNAIMFLWNRFVLDFTSTNNVSRLSSPIFVFLYVCWSSLLIIRMQEIHNHPAKRRARIDLGMGEGETIAPDKTGKKEKEERRGEEGRDKEEARREKRRRRDSESRGEGKWVEETAEEGGKGREECCREDGGRIE